MRSDPLTSSSLIDIKQQKTHRRKRLDERNPRHRQEGKYLNTKWLTALSGKPQHLLLRPDRIGLFPYVTWLLAKWPVTPITSLPLFSKNKHPGDYNNYWILKKNKNKEPNLHKY
jgi:hypothetical protein